MRSGRQRSEKACRCHGRSTATVLVSEGDIPLITDCAALTWSTLRKLAFRPLKCDVDLQWKLGVHP